MAQRMAYQYANMLNIAATEFSFDDVERFFRSDDCRWKSRPIISRSSSSSSTCDLRMSVQSGGVHPAVGVLYRPVNAGGRGFDHLFTSNMADGWESLLVSVSAHTNKSCISIRHDEQKIREFKVIRAGAIVRVVQAIRDGDRWNFFSAGEALGFEEQDFYASRVKKDRLPLELLVRYFKCCSGFDLSDQNTFRSERELLQLVEQRR